MPLRSRTLLGLLLLLIPALSAGCKTVEFYELEAFSDPVMTYGESAAQVHALMKILYSMEGSAGGIGTSAGGGCGCY